MMIPANKVGLIIGTVSLVYPPTTLPTHPHYPHTHTTHTPPLPTHSGKGGEMIKMLQVS